jgi:hypothetical protein
MTNDLLSKKMKRTLASALLALIICLVLSCGPKPSYKTAEGKKKLERYNKLQFGERKRY